MSWRDVNGVSLRYELGGQGDETVVLVTPSRELAGEVARLVAEATAVLESRPAAVSARPARP